MTAIDNAMELKAETEKREYNGNYNIGDMKRNHELCSTVDGRKINAEHSEKSYSRPWYLSIRLAFLA